MPPRLSQILIVYGLLAISSATQSDVLAQTQPNKHDGTFPNHEVSPDNRVSQTLHTEIFSEELSPQIQLTQYPLESAASADSDPTEALQDESTFHYLRRKLAEIPGEERGLVFSQTQFTTTYLPSSDGDQGLAFGTLDTRLTMHLAQMPFLRVTPRFGYHFLDGLQPGLAPSELYDTGIDASLYLPVSDQLLVMLMAGPGMFTDGQNTSGDAFRMTGGAIGIYTHSPTSKWMAGFLYLGREDVVAIPTGGWIYQPHDRAKYEFVFPRPKLAWMFQESTQSQHWVYVAGEYGGNTWAVERPDRSQDLFTYRDYRLILGVEQTKSALVNWNLEAGYVFGRQVQYRSATPDQEPSSTFLVRAGLNF